MKISLNERLFVILCRPKKPENIGLAARAMKNTGFENLRLAGLDRLGRKSFVTAIHAEEILKKASFYPSLSEAVSDLNVIVASTSRKRKNFPLLSLKEAISRIFQFPASSRIGLVFGNEITGLTSDELIRTNFRFSIPQSGDQPSYNLASAVLITLFSIFTHNGQDSGFVHQQPMSWKEQEESIRMILRKLEEKKFIHETNKKHVTEMVFSLFGRMILTEKDKALLLALFSKGPDSLE
jgi:TrmH family RNA methyltransferase